jgi:uroporphyrinogen-III decarboxylase
MKFALGLLAPLVALAWGALTWANAPVRERVTRHYTCELRQRVIALEHGQYVQLMVAGQTYELRWTSQTTARGQGLEWRVNPSEARLMRLSSGFAMANACVERATSF